MAAQSAYVTGRTTGTNVRDTIMTWEDAAYLAVGFVAGYYLVSHILFSHKVV